LSRPAGFRHTESTLAKLRVPNPKKAHPGNQYAKGKHYRYTPEQRQARSEQMQGHFVSEETREKLRQTNKGRKRPAWPLCVSAEWPNGECVYCLAPAITWDHVIPRDRPGWDAPDNLVPACESCNAQKQNRTPEEWFAERCQCWRCLEAA
jgi:5-methylcytosine-specific restriction endonuclease McrA